MQFKCPLQGANKKKPFFILKTAYYTSIYYIADNYFANETLLRGNRFIPDTFRCNEDDKNDFFQKVAKDYLP